MTESAYSFGTPGHRVARQHDLVAVIDRVHDQVGDGDVHRHARDDDRGDAEVAQHGIEVGATHRVEPVEAPEEDVARLGADLVDDRGLVAPGLHGHADLAGRREQAGVHAHAALVGARPRETVDDGHADGPSAPHEPGDVGDRLLAGRGAEIGERSRVADDAVLHFRRHDRGVRRVDELAQFHRHRGKYQVERVGDFLDRSGAVRFRWRVHRLAVPRHRQVRGRAGRRPRRADAARVRLVPRRHRPSLAPVRTGRARPGRGVHADHRQRHRRRDPVRRRRAVQRHGRRPLRPHDRRRATCDRCARGGSAPRSSPTTWPSTAARGAR